MPDDGTACARRTPSLGPCYDPDVAPLIAFAAGVAALLAGVALLSAFGGGYRLGRLLAATPEVAIPEAIEAAGAGDRRYVAIVGRVDADDEFLDEHERPLVFRRTRLQVRSGRRWATVHEDRRVIPFRISTAVGTIAVDAEALGEGLIVIPREAVGTAADVPADIAGLPPDTAASAPVRLRVEQLSSIDHATVLGVPQLATDGTARMAPGGSRPLVVCTLEKPEAMRVLAAGGRGPIMAATGLLIAGLAGIAVAAIWGVVAVAG